MTHKALELWLSADDPRLPPLLEVLALDAGLAAPEQRVEAVRRVRELIARFCDHPLRGEIASADERHHEVPYSRMSGERAESGYIDLLYQNEKGWQVIDFKTDGIRNEAMRNRLVAGYKSQLLRYENAIQSLLGQSPKISICFLDDHGSINLIQVN
jgi:ATP-dependent exoDNAse (exonuclease V) beta subunit